MACVHPGELIGQDHRVFRHDPDQPAAGHGLAGVARQIVERPGEHSWIGDYRPQPRGKGVITTDLTVGESRATRCLHQVLDPGDDLFRGRA